MYKKLPKKVLERVALIERIPDGCDGVIGIVWLKEGWEFDDGSHCSGFTSKQDLIDYVMEAERCI